MESLFEKYQNIQLFLEKYRGYTIVENSPNFYNYDDFKNKMQISGYISHQLENKTVDNKLLDIYLLKHDSKYVKATVNFKKILDKYKQEDTNIIVFTKEPLSVHIKKAIKKYPMLHVQNYLYKHFSIEINKGPLCSKHSILSPEEARRVCFELMTHGHKLPSISVDDPQNIWIGGNIDDIIKIESVSEITGTRILYRLVTPISGKAEESDAIKSKSSKSAKSSKVVKSPKVNLSDDAEKKEDIVEEEYEVYDEYDDEYEEVDEVDEVDESEE